LIDCLYIVSHVELLKKQQDFSVWQKQQL
jgi:hypothetical protein